MSSFVSRWCRCSSVLAIGCLSLTGQAQQQRHGRGYKAPPPTAQITVLVEKAFNQKPMPNASVVFRAERDGKLTGNLETKTDPDGKATLDLLEVGSHVTIQVIAGGFATYATDFDLTGDGKTIDVKLQRPRAQISQYNDREDGPAEVKPGVQEHQTNRAVPAPPASSPTAPLQTTPPVNTPAPDTAPASTPAKPGSPQ